MHETINVKQLAEMLQLTESEMQLVLDQKVNITDLKQAKIAENSNGNGGESSVPPQVGKLFYQRDNVTIFNEDFLTSQSLQPATVDLIVTSPPYNVGIDYGNHDDAEHYAQYLEFSRQWLGKSYELSRPDGRLCMNIPLDKNKGGQQSICADLTTIAKDIGWQYQSTIIWNEGNISRRTAWGSWLSASAPFVIAPVEVIVVMYKSQWKKLDSKDRVTGITKEEFIEWTNGMWTFNGESKKRVGHPAPFPRELPKRCIKLFSFEGDTVLDPFLGSGTTLLETAANNRIGIGFDIDENYCGLAKKRYEDEWLNYQLSLI